MRFGPLAKTLKKQKSIYGRLISTFKLNKPTEGYGKKVLPLKDGGAWGPRKEFVELVSKMI